MSRPVVIDTDGGVDDAVALWWALTFVAHTAWPWYALHVWIVAALLHACFPSRTDWRLAFPAIAVLIVLALLLGGYYFFVRMP